MKHYLLITSLAVLAACAAPPQQPLVQPSASPTIVAGYWECDEAGRTGLLGFGEATQCSVIYEALLKSFPGQTQAERYHQFMTWWRASKKY